MCQEQKQGTAHAPCSQHHKEVGKTPKPLSCPTPEHTPTLTYKKPAHPASGASQGTYYLFSLPPATTGTPTVFPECLGLASYQFLLTGEDQEPWSVSQPLWNLLSRIGSDGKMSAYSVGGLGSIPGSGRSPGEGNGNPLQYSCLENPLDGGAW